MKMRNAKIVDVDAIAADVSEALRKTGLDEFVALAQEFDQSRNRSEKIKIVVCGEYSAGKSSLIKALTGCSVKCGEGQVTAKAEDFVYENMIITDTPGIKAGSVDHADHDDKAYAAISAADLVLYVTGNTLFDDTLFKDFLRLAFDKGKADDMMLIVNKMECEANGNTPDSQKIKERDINEWLAPQGKTARDFRTTYISVKHWEAYLENPEGKMEQLIYKRQSGIDLLKEGIARFASERGLAGKETSSFNVIEHFLLKAEELASKKSPEVDAAISLQKDKRRELDEVVRALNEVRRNNGEHVALAISQKRDALIGQLPTLKSLDDFKASTDKIACQIEESIKSSIDEMAKGLTDKCKKGAGKIEGLDASVYARRIREAFKDTKEIGSSSSMASGGKKAGEYFSKAGKTLNAASAPKEGLKGLRAFGGTSARDAIVKVGHWLGHTFKPYEALKWAKGINVAGKALGVLGILIEPAAEYFDERNEDKREKALEALKAQIVSAFDDVAQSVRSGIDKTHELFVAENIKPDIEANDAILKRLRHPVEAKQALLTKVNVLIEKIRQLKASFKHK